VPTLRRIIVCGLLLAGPVRAAHAEVVDVGPGGFTVKTSLDFAAIPKAAYIAFVVWVGSWWDPAHTASGDAKNLSIDPRLGGCFCERLADGGAVQHMTIVRLQPERLVRFSGALGPLQEMAVTGTMTWSFVPTSTSMRVEALYTAGGYAKDGFADVAKAVDAVLASQVQRLKRFVESGRF
jgi:hypothetical protein